MRPATSNPDSHAGQFADPAELGRRRARPRHPAIASARIRDMGQNLPGAKVVSFVTNQTPLFQMMSSDVANELVDLLACLILYVWPAIKTVRALDNTALRQQWIRFWIGALFLWALGSVFARLISAVPKVRALKLIGAVVLSMDNGVVMVSFTDVVFLPLCKRYEGLLERLPAALFGWEALPRTRSTKT
jgi:hypothetical protein